ncbi:hypothetical protein WA026_010230 [Henosepilachna vigintioctopunctata]|uniref:Anoctamin n=1 Tax=Henosepilachna vigintioctopunctata TaxID=420089 RepID=A0AAW1UCT0_9CUCU
MKNTLETVEEQLYKLRKFRRHDDSEPTPYYFRDGKRKIHYVIVLHDNAIYNKEVLNKVMTYLDFMEFQGLEFEFEIGLMDTKLLYLKVHATDKVIEHFANMYDIDIHNAGHNYLAEHRWNFRLTELTRQDGDVFRREGKPTSCEIILIVHKILSDPLTFNEKEIEGLNKMIKSGYIKDAFPLHDGVWQWTEARQQYLNDRQILSKYWANFGALYKAQPINLVEKYFGTNVAFFFAWFEHYNNMLCLLAVIGTSLVVMNSFILMNKREGLLIEICRASNKTFICPMCGDGECAFIPISKYCETTKLEFAFTNASAMLSVFIAVFISVIVKIWRRREGSLKVRWNVQHSEEEYKVRADYKIKNPYTKISKLTGKTEYYTPLRIKILRYSVTYFMVVLSIILITLGVISLIVMKIWMTDHLDPEDEPKRTMRSCLIYSVSQVIFIKIFSYLYIGMSQWLTTKEVPKTEKAYDDSVIYKIYLLGFMNNYLPVIYAAFVSDNTGLAGRDRCLPNGCGLTVAIQIFVVVFIKCVGRLVSIGIYQSLRDSRFAMLQTSTVSDTKMYIPTWEKEYYLSNPDKMFLNLEFFEMMIQFGYISFFGAASPLIAIVAFVCNIFDLRFKAVRLLCKSRRPVPVMAMGIGSWNKVITFISYVSAVTNILILMLHTRFIHLWVYSMYESVSEVGYLDYFYSRYAVTDLHPKKQEEVPDNITECLYSGFAYPPGHSRKYEKTDVYYLILVWKFGFMLIAQNVIAVFVAAMYFYFDDTPRRVQEQLHREKLYAKELRLKLLEGKMQMNRSIRSDQSAKSGKSAKSTKSKRTSL